MMKKGYLVYHIIKQAQSYQSYEKLVLLLHTIGQYIGQKYNSRNVASELVVNIGKEVENKVFGYLSI